MSERRRGKSAFARITAQIAAESGRRVLLVSRNGSKVVKPLRDHDPDGPIGTCPHAFRPGHEGHSLCLPCVVVFCDACWAQHDHEETVK